MELEREKMLSIKRSQQLLGMSNEVKRMFDNEPQNIVEIADSPPRSSPSVDDSDRYNIPQSSKVRFPGVHLKRKNNYDLNGLLGETRIISSSPTHCAI